MIKPIHLTVLIIYCFLSFACRKSLSPAGGPTGTPGVHDSVSRPTPPHDSSLQGTIPFPVAPVTGCSYAPDYGDTILFPQPNNGQDYIVHPVNSPGAGKFLSWPTGMVIDSLTGAINVTKSETGLKYAIGFVKAGTTDTCLTKLIIGGAAYMDSIYVIENGAKTALPYFDANPYLPSVCANGGCTFDITGDAALHKVIINNTTGVIDLEKTLNGTSLLGGAFGLLPLNGMTVTSTIYYRLNDASNNALQHIDVQFVYYYSRAQIGGGLLNNVLSRLTNLLSGNMITTAANPRPPLIVIVRKSQ